MKTACYGLLLLAMSMKAQTPSQPAKDCTVGGTVVNALTNEPIAGAMVTLSESRGTGSATDANGHWSISNATCEVVTPKATHAGFFDGQYGASTTSGQVLPGASELPLTSGTPSDLKLVLVPEGSVSGRVQDVNGNPVDHADIGLKEFAVSGGKRLFVNGPYTQTNGRGEFWIGGLRPGRYVVCAGSANRSYPVGGGAAEIYLEDCFPGAPSAGAASTMEVKGREVQVSLLLRAARASHVRGRVSGAPDLKGIEVELAKSPGDPLRDRSADGVPALMPFGHSAASGPDGSFDIAGVPPGSYRAEALSTKGEILFAEALVNVGGDDIEDVRLALTPMASLSGNVRLETSKPPPDAKPMSNVSIQLSFSLSRGKNFADAQWDGQNFVVPQVPPGEYLLFVSPDASSGTWVKSATLRGRDVLNQPVWVNGATGPVEIVLTDSVSDVDITTKDANGNPADGWIVLKTATGSTILVQAQKGYVEKHGVPPGEYKVWAFDDLTAVPWAEDEWMAQNAGPGQKVTVIAGSTASVTVTRTAAPRE